jgi:AraC family transcriptional regulator, exoenzyme S synthesis regulatory protein ExsA
MLFRFPPTPADPGDTSFLALDTATYAKYKRVNRSGTRNVFLTEHTLVFTIRGTKLLHLPGQVLNIGPDSIVLLKRGVYVMAEYLENGMDFEALMLFLPVKTVQEFVRRQKLELPKGRQTSFYVVAPANELLLGFRDQYRHYFGKALRDMEQLLSVKIQELLLLLLETPQRGEVLAFLSALLQEEPEDLGFVVRTYLFQPLTLEELADLSNRSLATFKRDFQRQFQMAPRQWINQQRLEHARMLLQTTERRVADIAVDCGFESASHFIRIFRKAFGVTPGAIRAERTIS